MLLNILVDHIFSNQLIILQFWPWENVMMLPWCGTFLIEKPLSKNIVYEKTHKKFWQSSFTFICLLICSVTNKKLLLNWKLRKAPKILYNTTFKMNRIYFSWKNNFRSFLYWNEMLNLLLPPFKSRDRLKSVSWNYPGIRSIGISCIQLNPIDRITGKFLSWPFF